MTTTLKVLIIFFSVISAFFVLFLVLRHLAKKRLKEALIRAGYYEDWKSSDGTIYTDIIYGRSDRLNFDLYVPVGIDQNSQQGLILFIHGGSWFFGNKSHIAFAARRYAKAGYLSACLNYSLLSKDQPNITFQTMLDDIQDCIAKIKETTQNMGFDVHKIALSGISAGGHLALLYGYARQAQSALPVAFLAVQTGPSDFHPETTQHISKTARSVFARKTGIKFSKSDYKDPAVLKLVEQSSPVSFITENSPPTLMAYGGKDHLVPPQNRNLLIQALSKAGVSFTDIFFPNSNHLLADDPASRDAYHQAFLSYAQKYFKRDPE